MQPYEMTISVSKPKQWKHGEDEQNMNEPPRVITGQWPIMEKVKGNQGTVGTDSTVSSDSYQQNQDDISELSYTESSFEALDLSTEATISLEAYWEKTVEDRLSKFGSKDRRTAEAYFNKGTAYMKIRYYESAYTDFSIAACILEELHGSKHLGLARCLHHQGLAAYRKGRLSTALSSFEAAFKIRNESLGLHIDTVDTCSRIGSVYYKQNDFSHALQYYKEVMAGTCEIVGETHPAVAETAQAIAKIYVKMKKSKRARKLYKQALRTYERLGNHRKVAQVEKAMQRIGVQEKRRVEV